MPENVSTLTKIDGASIVKLVRDHVTTLQRKGMALRVEIAPGGETSLVALDGSARVALHTALATSRFREGATSVGLTLLKGYEPVSYCVSVAEARWLQSLR